MSARRTQLHRLFSSPGSIRLNTDRRIVESEKSSVYANEIGHHVQKLLGISDKVRALRLQDSAQANPLSVRLELQADYFAGIWANSTAQRAVVPFCETNS